MELLFEPELLELELRFELDLLLEFDEPLRATYQRSLVSTSPVTSRTKSSAPARKWFA